MTWRQFFGYTGWLIEGALAMGIVGVTSAFVAALAMHAIASVP